MCISLCFFFSPIYETNDFRVFNHFISCLRYTLNNYAGYTNLDMTSSCERNVFESFKLYSSKNKTSVDICAFENIKFTHSTK